MIDQDRSLGLVGVIVVVMMVAVIVVVMMVPVAMIMRMLVMMDALRLGRGRVLAEHQRLDRHRHRL